MNLTIKRSEWLRGEDDKIHPNDSMLYRPRDGKRCCLGFLGLACGLTDSAMSDVPAPDCIPASWPSGLLDGCDQFPSTSGLCDTIIKTNDSASIIDEERERRLTHLFAQIGVEVTFVP